MHSREKEKKLFLFADDMSACVENPKYSTKNENCWVLVAHAYNPSTWEQRSGGLRLEASSGKRK
jgi:hypothetical protein